MDTRHRLSFICHEFPPIGGGAASALDRFTATLAKRGHHIQIITIGHRWYTEQSHDALGREIVRLGAGRSSCLSPSLLELFLSLLVLQFRSAPKLRSFAPTAIIAYFSFPGGFAVRGLARRLGLPLLLSLRGSDVPGFFSNRWGLLRPLHPLLARPAMREADLVLANGAYIQELAQRFMPDLAVENLPNGIDCQAWPPGPLRAAGQPLRVLFVGQFIPRKRCLEVLDALHWVGEHGIIVEACFVGEGPLGTAMEERISRLPATIRVRLPGTVAREAMSAFFQQHEVLVHISQAEGISNVLLEALASGVAIIASTATAWGALAQSPAIQVLETITPASLGTALATLAQDRDTLNAMRQAATISAQQFDWQQTAQRFEELLLKTMRDQAANKS